MCLGQLEVGGGGAGTSENKKEKKRKEEEEKKSVKKNHDSKNHISKCFSTFWIYNFSEIPAVFLWV